MTGKVGQREGASEMDGEGEKRARLLDVPPPTSTPEALLDVDD